MRTLAPPAVQGQAGEKTLFDVAATLKDHAISKDTAIDLLRDFSVACRNEFDDMQARQF